MRTTARLNSGGKTRLPAAAQSLRCQQRISPPFYLIICPKFVDGNAKKAYEIPAKSSVLTSFCQNKNTFCFLRIPIPNGLQYYPIMSLNLSDVKRLAHLAQLDLNEDQATKTLDKLNGIFALVEQMRAVDTSGVEPLNHPIAAHQNDVALRLRDDEVTEPNRRDDYQQIAPATQDGLYLVPKVIE